MPFQVGDTRARKPRRCPHLTLRVPHRVLADKLVDLRIFFHALPCRRLLGRDRLRADHRVRRQPRRTAAKGGRARKGRYVNRLRDETARESRQRAQVTGAGPAKGGRGSERAKGVAGTARRAADRGERVTPAGDIGGCRTAAPACEIWRSSSAALMPARATQRVSARGRWRRQVLEGPAPRQRIGPGPPHPPPRDRRSSPSLRSRGAAERRR